MKSLMSPELVAFQKACLAAPIQEIEVAQYAVYIRHDDQDPEGDELVLATDDREEAQNRAEREAFRRGYVVRLEEFDEPELWWEFSPTQGWSQEDVGSL